MLALEQCSATATFCWRAVLGCRQRPEVPVPLSSLQQQRRLLWLPWQCLHVRLSWWQASWRYAHRWVADTHSLHAWVHARAGLCSCALPHSIPWVHATGLKVSTNAWPILNSGLLASCSCEGVGPRAPHVQHAPIHQATNGFKASTRLHPPPGEEAHARQQRRSPLKPYPSSRHSSWNLGALSVCSHLVASVMLHHVACQAPNISEHQANALTHSAHAHHLQDLEAALEAKDG